MIRAENLTKRFGDTTVVRELSFEAQPGEVTALLGPPKSGKTTILRMLVALVRPSSGTSEILGRPYAELDDPGRRVGAMIGGRVDPRQRPRDHLRMCAALAGVGDDRVETGLEESGLAEQEDLRAGALPVAARRRLAVASALLAEPEVVLLDDAAAGLDENGVDWLEARLRGLADDDATVLVAGHELNEMTRLADQVLLLENGSLVATSPAKEVIRQARDDVVVRSPGAEVLAAQLERAGVGATRVSSEELRARDVAASVVTELAVSNGLPLWEVRSETPSLVDVLARMAETNGAGPESEHDVGGVDLDGLDESLDRELARLPAISGTRIVVVAAPDGPLGATTLSFAIGDVLAELAAIRTLTVSLGRGDGRLRLPAPAEQRSNLDLADLLRDLASFDDAARITPYVSVAHSGLHTLAGLPDDVQGEPLEEEALETLIAFASRFYELLVLDMGELPDGALSLLLRKADEVVLVGSLEAAGGSTDSALLDALERERSQRSLLVMNRVDPRLAAEHSLRPRGSHAVVPEDRRLIRALDAGGFRLSEQGPATRVALKRLGLLVGEGLK
jgi:ABC-2 type transport system ATP-binding protein